jgi:4-hydroxy 2-oxovalerate aldolase/long-chain acyl-CoA synthetase
MFVAANFMKSYVLTPEEFAQKVKIAENYGADMVYIVDSAGGMFEHNIKEYYDAVKKISNIPIGFHGHDNLGLAVSNSLAAAKFGIEFLDSSLQGLGRSAGNAATEILVFCLMKLGYKLNIDYLKLLDVGYKYIQPLVPHKGKIPLDIVSGFAEFHSSYMPYMMLVLFY